MFFSLILILVLVLILVVSFVVTCLLMISQGSFLAFVVFLSSVSVNYVSGLLVVLTLKLGQT